MTSAYVYSHKTLNDNWCEDRNQPPGAQTTIGNIDQKITRKYESEIAYVGERFDVLTRIGRMPQRPSFGVPDDGFRERVRTSLVDFADPRSHKEFVAKSFKKAEMITTETVPEVCHEERRPLPGNVRGFGAVLNRHDENHGIRHWNTTSDDCFGKRPNGSLKLSRSEPSLLRASGVSTQHEQDRATGMKVGVLCGEEFRDNNFPASDTKTQRAWVFDASINNIHHGGTKPKVRGKPDNALSLPLGDGAMSKIRSDLAERRGMLYRVATNITKGRDKRPGVAIFKDDP
jgi:hypothetical protein